MAKYRICAVVSSKYRGPAITHNKHFFTLTLSCGATTEHLGSNTFPPKKVRCNKCKDVVSNVKIKQHKVFANCPLTVNGKPCKKQAPSLTALLNHVHHIHPTASIEILIDSVEFPLDPLLPFYKHSSEIEYRNLETSDEPSPALDELFSGREHVVKKS